MNDRDRENLRIATVFHRRRLGISDEEEPDKDKLIDYLTERLESLTRKIQAMQQ